MPEITEFAVRGLYGYRDITIPIRDNKIVLVGVNGLGKTTIINLLYFCLSHQWGRIDKYDCSEMSLEIDGERVTFSQTTDEDINEAAMIPKASKEEELFAEKHFHQYLESQILYLPTYRRIEKELETIFPELDEDVNRYHREVRIKRGIRIKREHRRSEYVELIEFGMKDVAQKINDTLSEIKENARTQLNNLAGSYLRDVIRREANSFDSQLIKKLDDDTVTKILNRVEEKTLNTEDKKTLKIVIENIQKDSQESISEQDKYLVHFFTQLVNIHNSLTEQESMITQFVEVCNRYLEGKNFYYDEKNYRLEIKLDNQTPLELSMLSSGEKQIVSLFSHLYLSGEKQYMILLDEPELSLSVEWQKHFLPDILASNRCQFLAAATHSPFIFYNELDDYAEDIRECIKDTK